MEHTADAIFLHFAVDKLQQLASRIGDCLGKLDQKQVWERGDDNQNAIGNLVLHLSGNVRQWIVSGIGGKPDIRVRDREFSARGDIQPSELQDRLQAAVEEAAAVLKNVTPARLLERVTIQKYDVTVLEAIFHVVEHFAGHAGQIIFATKMLTSQDLGFYKHLQAKAHAEKTP